MLSVTTFQEKDMVTIRDEEAEAPVQVQDQDLQKENAADGRATGTAHADVTEGIVSVYGKQKSVGEAEADVRVKQEPAENTIPEDGNDCSSSDADDYDDVDVEDIGSGSDSGGDSDSEKPPWKPSASTFPVPKMNKDRVPLLRMIQKHDDGEQESDGYTIPAIASSLDSYQKTWDKFTFTTDPLPQHASETDTKRRIHDDFRRAIFTDRIDIKNDTSITGRYAKKKYKPFGFEPSTEEACKQEVYKVIKPSMCLIQAEDQKPEPQPSYYQSFDPGSMRFEPTSASSLAAASIPPVNTVDVSRAFPLGAAAANTRAALLSFMGTKTGGLPGILVGGSAQSVVSSSTSAMHGNFLGNVSSSSVKNRTESFGNIPEKIILTPPVVEPQGRKDPDTVQRIVPSEHGGGKKIEKVVWKKKMVEREDGRTSKSKRNEHDDEESYEDASSKWTKTSTEDTDDATSDRSHLRRTKRPRSSRKFHDS